MLDNFKSHFKFNKQERSGIFFLLLILISIQVGYYIYNSQYNSGPGALYHDAILQKRIDSLKRVSVKTDSLRIYPFNPNFISDFKGYSLGMSLEEIDRLHEYRATNKFVNTKEEFQEVTKVSDSLLGIIAPFFKFPEWTKKNTSKEFYIAPSLKKEASDEPITLFDLNMATAEDLQKISGIGEKLSARIVKFRDLLGGFLIDDQLNDVYGLDEEVVQRALLQFTVINKPEIALINVNEASVEELSKLIYLQKDVAQRIVNYRNLNGGIKSLNDLLNIEGFPIQRIDRIALYLSL